jgi:hypothetical protein
MLLIIFQLVLKVGVYVAQNSVLPAQNDQETCRILDTDIRDEGFNELIIVPTSFFICKYSFTESKCFNTFMSTANLRIVGNMTVSSYILVPRSD